MPQPKPRGGAVLQSMGPVPPGLGGGDGGPARRRGAVAQVQCVHQPVVHLGPERCRPHLEILSRSVVRSSGGVMAFGVVARAQGLRGDPGGGGGPGPRPPWDRQWQRRAPAGGEGQSGRR
ncbi:hypothetical protein NDU88_002544 [Pleurodeles waltl]|uniref:Uncharacterized protein n=1 Tax=Pleurodeles waltl TaxID=8319 RepID=A0AAV7KSH9_PLEWA|nr:hypothetical protein NDU88_002544 [Pleurodeles waltl]